MKKDKKEFINTDYLAQLRKNHLYGVNYFNDVENEFASEEDLDFESDYYKTEETKKKDKKEKNCTCKCENKNKKNK